MLTDQDRLNLAKLEKYFSFHELRPAPDIYEINIPENQYFVDIGQGKKKRFIFYKVPYSKEENEKIAEVKESFEDAQIFENYQNQLILKHLYASDMNIKKCLQRLQKLQDFQRNETVTTLSKQTITRLKSGCIYTYGHDLNRKPIVILRADRFDYNLSIQQNYNPVYFLMLVVLGFRTVPYHAEKYVCIFDLCDMNMTEIPYRYLYEVFTMMNLFYCCNSQRTFVLNAKGIGSMWSFASTFIPEHTKKKIIFINETNKDDLFKYIDRMQMQKQYGGQLQDLKEYWPPKCTNEQFDVINMYNTKQKINETDTDSQMFSVENNVEFFEASQSGCGNAGCSCKIF